MGRYPKVSIFVLQNIPDVSIDREQNIVTGPGIWSISDDNLFFFVQNVNPAAIGPHPNIPLAVFLNAIDVV
jgi:hypothetical protein